MVWVGNDPTQPTLQLSLVEGRLPTWHVTPGPVVPPLGGVEIIIPFPSTENLGSEVSHHLPEVTWLRFKGRP